VWILAASGWFDGGCGMIDIRSFCGRFEEKTEDFETEEKKRLL
jgi:hypothetical protein